MRQKLVGALALSFVIFIGGASMAGAQECTGASPSDVTCGPEVSPSRVLSSSASRPAVAANSAAENDASALAFTGSDAGQLALLGVGAVTLGLVLRSRASARRRNPE